MRLDRMRPAEVQVAAGRAKIAYVPLGAIEFHGPHLPLGVDMMTAEEVCRRAAAITGGVVLPPSFITHGTLDLPWTLEFTPGVVESWVREVVAQLHRRGFSMVVLLTGHGPLDLVHRLKRVARESSSPGARVLAACYLEFNAVRLTGPEQGEPTVIDHASTVETSYVMAIDPAAVDLAALPDDTEARVTGVYGRNPRFTADPAWADADMAAGAVVLSQRIAQAERGDLDDLADLRRFVELAWPEPLELCWESVAGAAVLTLRNSGRASRFITGITSLSIGGAEIDLDGVDLVNASPGEPGAVVVASALSPESGLYVRSRQSACLTLPSTADFGAPASLSFELGGVIRNELVARALRRGDLDTATTP